MINHIKRVHGDESHFLCPPIGDVGWMGWCRERPSVLPLVPCPNFCHLKWRVGWYIIGWCASSYSRTGYRMGYPFFWAYDIERSMSVSFVYTICIFFLPPLPPPLPLLFLLSFSLFSYFLLGPLLSLPSVPSHLDGWTSVYFVVNHQTL